jgi:adenosylmethionine-8-amino-7-oxononanoate aminotransferase
MGDYLFERLQMLSKHKIVGDVRGGLGLLCGIELVKDRATRERFPKEAKLGEKMNVQYRKHKLLGRATDVISLSPPLCITKDEVDEVVERLDNVIAGVSEML